MRCLASVQQISHTLAQSVSLTGQCLIEYLLQLLSVSTSLICIDVSYRAMGGAEVIDSTYQLIGKFLMFKNRDTTNVQNAQDFFLWLKAKGITSHVNDIVEAVAEKVLHIFHVIKA